jgi:ketosteroid isomerase-like protein
MPTRSKNKIISTRTLSRTALAATFLALILFASGCSQPAPKDTRAADESALRDLDAQWAKAAAAKDLNATVAFYSDDASVFPPNSPIASDKASIRAAWTSLLSPDTSITWQASKADVARSADLGYVAGVYQMTMKDPHGKPVTDTGKFVEVWKKQADGSWKTVADIFNSDLPVATQSPAPAPAPEKKKAHHARSRKKRHPRSSGT